MVDEEEEIGYRFHCLVDLSKNDMFVDKNWLVVSKMNKTHCHSLLLLLLLSMEKNYEDYHIDENQVLVQWKFSLN